MGATGDARTIRLTGDILVEYVVSRARLLVFSIEVLTDQDVLVPGGN
ncbi:hypothetical protein [Streptomyces anandii]